ncbi:MAG: SDR family NAD(P)-dependent oxidoreductase [Rickettsiales bacterium]
MHIWIIGASHGIGAALAKKLAADGHHLALSGRDVAALTAVRDSFPHGYHHVLPLDVTDDAGFPKAIEHLNAHWPRIDRVIYNSGISPVVTEGIFDPATFRKVLDVNLIGAFVCASAMLETWKKQGGGHLAMVASVAGYRGLPHALSYCASKAGLICLAESLAMELHPLGVKVQVVNPGFVKTRLTDKNDFPMPMMISAEEAAIAFARGLEKDVFEINFPKRFTFLMKLLSLLPDALYFYVMRRFASGR